MEVYNLKGTAGLDCRCGTWIKHWKNFTNESAEYCKAKGCTKKATDGAHVKKCVNYDQKHYIIPFCREHNLMEGCIEINSGTDLVSANRQNTCEN